MRKRILELTRHKDGLNKNELCIILAEEMKLEMVETRRILDALLGLVTEAMAMDKKVLISDFGTFQIMHREGFDGYNPHTDERIPIPPRSIPSFKAGKLLKQRLNPKLD